MTVEKLIDVLETIENKSLEVTVQDYSESDTEYIPRILKELGDRVVITLNGIY